MPDVRVLPCGSAAAVAREPLTCWTREQIADMADALYLRNSILLALRAGTTGRIATFQEADETVRAHFTGLAVTALDVAARLQLKAT